MLRTPSVSSAHQNKDGNKKSDKKHNKNAKKRKPIEANITTIEKLMKNGADVAKKPKIKLNQSDKKNGGHSEKATAGKKKNKNKKPKAEPSPVSSDGSEDMNLVEFDSNNDSNEENEVTNYIDQSDMDITLNSSTSSKNSKNSPHGKPSHSSKGPPKMDVMLNGGKGSSKLRPLESPANVVNKDSIAEGLKTFLWMINPVAAETFFEKYWEKNALLVKRRHPDCYKELISFEAIDQMLLNNHVEYGKNIDITSYENGVRETLNPEGRAMPGEVWDFYRQNCSIRLLNPHMFLFRLFQLNTTMQEYFHCLVGANAYLTPPNSQGFAPHYDDIEAFVLQIEGRKRWKLYKPRRAREVLPRVSSANFSQDEIGEPISEYVLEAGDLLYFPRGTIHQACTEPGYHSLHITLSVYQKQSYADLFEKMMPMIMERAIASTVELRRGLPLHTWRNAGLAFSEVDSQERATFLSKVTKLLGQSLKKVCLDEVVDAAVDQLAKKYQHEALPPYISSQERSHTVLGARTKTNEQGEAVSNCEITLRTNIRLLRANILRLVKEENTIRIYYYLDNSKEYCEFDANFIEIDSQDASSVEVLMKSYPEYIGVSQLPVQDDEQKITIATVLFNRGLLFLEKPLSA